MTPSAAALAGLLLCTAAAAAQPLDLSAAVLLGDAQVMAGTVTLSNAYVDPIDPALSEPGGTGAGSALAIDLLEAGLGLPPVALGETATEGSALTLEFSSTESLELAFDWTLSGDLLWDMAFVRMGSGPVELLSQPASPIGQGRYAAVLGPHPAHRIQFGVVDWGDAVAVSTFKVTGLTTTPAVPEPGSAALLLLGLGALLVSRLRAAQRSATPLALPP